MDKRPEQALGKFGLWWLGVTLHAKVRLMLSAPNHPADLCPIRATTSEGLTGKGLARWRPLAIHVCQSYSQRFRLLRQDSQIE